MIACHEDPGRQGGVTARSSKRLTLLAAIAALAIAGEAAAQLAPATLLGSLINRDTRIPVEGARVAIIGTGLVTNTDSSGRFLLAGVAPGVRVVQIRAVGYSIGSWLVQVDEGQTLRHEFEMEPRIYALADLTVSATERSAFNWRSEAAFEVRRARLPGYFLGREEIAARRPSTLADLLHGVPGVNTVCAGRNCRVTMSRSTRQCSPEYFLDGHQATNATGPSFPIHQIRGVEIYRSEFETPVEFQRFGLRCGVIAIWTVEPGERLDRPGRRLGERDSTRADPQGLPPRRPDPRPDEPCCETRP
jgi:hypothetical protein